MINFFRSSTLLFALLLHASVYAADIQVESAWTRATLPGQNVGMVSLTITSKQTATLMGVTSTASESAEMHQMTHDNNMMKMREVKAIALPAGKRVDFAEDGYHLMLIGLKSALQQGESVSLILSIRRANQRVIKVKTQVTVKPFTATQMPDK